MIDPTPAMTGVITTAAELDGRRPGTVVRSRHGNVREKFADTRWYETGNPLGLTAYQMSVDSWPMTVLYRPDRPAAVTVSDEDRGALNLPAVADLIDWLAQARLDYSHGDDEMSRAIQSESNAARLMAQAIRSGDAWGWLHSRRWDEFGARYAALASRPQAAASVSREQLRSLAESYAYGIWPEDTVAQDPELITDIGIPTITEWLHDAGIEVRDE